MGNLKIKIQLESSELKTLLDLLAKLNGEFQVILHFLTQLAHQNNKYEFFLKYGLGWFYKYSIPLEKHIQQLPISHYHSLSSWTDTLWELDHLLLNLSIFQALPYSKKFYYQEDFPKNYLTITKPFVKLLINLNNLLFEIIKRAEGELSDYLNKLVVDGHTIKRQMNFDKS